MLQYRFKQDDKTNYHDVKSCKRGFKTGNRYKILYREPKHIRKLDQHTRELENCNSARELESCMWAHKVVSRLIALSNLIQRKYSEAYQQLDVVK